MVTYATRLLGSSTRFWIAGAPFAPEVDCLRRILATIDDYRGGTSRPAQHDWRADTGLAKGLTNHTDDERSERRPRPPSSFLRLSEGRADYDSAWSGKEGRGPGKEEGGKA